jgi:hypothetical protein
VDHALFAPAQLIFVAHCNQCGAGTGLILIRKLHGWDHKTAWDEVDKIMSNGAPDR